MNIKAKGLFLSETRLLYFKDGFSCFYSAYCFDFYTKYNAALIYLSFSGNSLHSTSFCKSLFRLISSQVFLYVCARQVASAKRCAIQYTLCNCDVIGHPQSAFLLLCHHQKCDTGIRTSLISGSLPPFTLTKLQVTLIQRSYYCTYELRAVVSKSPHVMSRVEGSKATGRANVCHTNCFLFVCHHWSLLVSLQIFLTYILFVRYNMVLHMRRTRIN